MTLLVIAALLRSSRGEGGGASRSRVLRLLATALAGLAAISCPGAPLTADAAQRGRPTPAAQEIEPADLDEMPYPDSGTADPGGDAASVEGDGVRLARILPLAPEPMAPFFEALDAMERSGSGLVRVLHYGDSHTAADLLTAEIRHALQDRFGDGGRGFVHLGKPWKSYRPKDVSLDASRGDWRSERILLAVDPTELDGRYGLGGVCATASREGAFVRVGTAKEGAYGRASSSFDIFYMAQRGGGSFDVRLDGRVVGTVSTAGRGPRTGFFEARAASGPHELEIRLRGDGEVRLFGVAIEGDGPGLVYDNLGLNGAFFYTQLRWDAALQTEQIARRDPDLVIAMYGSNEVDSRSITRESYREDVRRVMGRLREGAPGAACLLLGPPDRKPRDPVAGLERLAWIIETQREVADEIGCGFVDLRALMGGPGSQEAFLRTGLGQRDGVHLTSKGYRVLGERLASELLDAYETWRRGERPAAPGQEMGR